MKSVSGAWRADFHPHWGHCPPHTPTNGWWAMLPWLACLFFPFRGDGAVLATSQYFLRRRKMLWLLIFLGHCTCHVHWLNRLSLLLAWWTSVHFYTTASALPSGGAFLSFSRWTMLLFFSLLTLTAFSPYLPIAWVQILAPPLTKRDPEQVTLSLSEPQVPPL